jgi:ATP-dependent DNA helicase PIF1
MTPLQSYEAEILPDEQLHALTPPGLPPHNLILKIGCPIVLVRNLNVKQGLCNGSRLIVTDTRENFITVKFPNGNDTFMIPRIPLVAQESSIPFHLKRLQFPVRLAFSMTINKSQGQTFERVGLHLENPVFTHGQLYVGLSRVRRQEDISVFVGRNEKLKLLTDPTNDQDYKSQTLNIVFPEVVRRSNKS